MSRNSSAVSSTGAVHRVAMGGRVEPERTALQDRARVPRCAPDQRLDPGQHLLHLEGFGEVVVGARAQPHDLLAPGAARGQDQHGHGAPVLAPALQDRESVQHRQAEVEHHCIIRLCIAQEVPLLAIVGEIDHETRRLERASRLLGDPMVVFDNEDPHGAGVSRPPRSRGSGPRARSARGSPHRTRARAHRLRASAASPHTPTARRLRPRAPARP